jgi:hypothetical protein
MLERGRLIDNQGGGKFTGMTISLCVIKNGSFTLK